MWGLLRHRFGEATIIEEFNRSELGKTLSELFLYYKEFIKAEELPAMRSAVLGLQYEVILLVHRFTNGEFSSTARFLNINRTTLVEKEKILIKDEQTQQWLLRNGFLKRNPSKYNRGGYSSKYSIYLDTLAADDEMLFRQEYPIHNGPYFE